MSYWSQISPTGAIADFASQWRNGSPYRWRVLALSIAATSSLFLMLIPESQRAEPERPKIVYITSYAAGRSDAEITASNQENQRQKEIAQQQLAEAEERRKEIYRTLGRATGVDVDAMERKIAADKAVEDAARNVRAAAARQGDTAPQGNTPQSNP